MNYKPHIALVISHPIQHFCPQYVSFTNNEEVCFKVFFASALGSKKYYDANFNKEISWGNLRLDDFDHRFLNGNIVILPDKSMDALTLEKELKEYKPDLVIMYGYFHKFQRRSYRWAIRNNVKMAYISDSELRHDRNWIKKCLKYIFLRLYFLRISYFLSVGDANEEYYKYYGVINNNIIRMHFPIDINQYEKSYNIRHVLCKNIREKYNLRDNDIIVTVVGKLSPWKNQDHVINALEVLENEGIYIHLFIIGSGEMYDIWKNKANILKYSKIHFTGFINIEELPGYYAATNIYVHPASIEPHSIAISEAIYMGCPIIVSNRCGSYGENDDVQEGKNGFVYEFGNIKDLADKIKNLVLDSEKRECFSLYSHNIAIKYQHQSHIGVLKDICKRLTV